MRVGLVGQLVVSWMGASAGRCWACAAIAAWSWASCCLMTVTSPVRSDAPLLMVLVSTSGGTGVHLDCCSSIIALRATFCARTAARCLSLDAMVACASLSSAAVVVAELAIPALWHVACSSRHSAQHCLQCFLKLIQVLSFFSFLFQCLQA